MDLSLRIPHTDILLQCMARESTTNGVVAFLLLHLPGTLEVQVYAAMVHGRSLQRRLLQVVSWLVGFLSQSSPTLSVTLQQSYSDARTIRALQGHDVALPYYRTLLTWNPQDFTAATRIASDPDARARHGRLVDWNPYMVDTDHQPFIQLLRECNFNPTGIAQHIFQENQPKSLALSASAPLYLQPLRSGTKAPPLPNGALETCIQLFLLAVSVPVAICRQYLGETLVDKMENMGIAFRHDDLVVPYCHITPVQCADKTLYLATDLHPNVLSITSFGDDNHHLGDDNSFANEPVMYIGPDSIALVDHWNSLPRWTEEAHHIVDFGTGSGIQALTMATMLQNTPDRSTMMPKVTCVDLNPRALRLARLNFAWNGLQQPEWILGDLQLENSGRRLLDDTNNDCHSTCQSWGDLIGNPTIILSNPPFLPVPIQDETIAKRHGLYSSGGKSGEDILRRVVEMAAECLAPNGTLAIVSEFMNPQTSFSSRLSEWWQKRPAKAVLFTNAQAMDASTYASRRADSLEELERWLDHLSTEAISHISPGLLFIKKIDGCTNEIMDISNLVVPKTTDGSIWTPTNQRAREYTRKKLIDLGIYTTTMIR